MVLFGCSSTSSEEINSGVGVVKNVKVFYNTTGTVFNCGFKPTLVIAVNSIQSAGRACEYYYSQNNQVLLNYGWRFHTDNNNKSDAITITENGFIRYFGQGGDNGGTSLIVALKIE